MHTQGVRNDRSGGLDARYNQSVALKIDGLAIVGR